ncbi:bleomycin resistance protein [Pectobacterium sp. B2J-2]|uniref:bleomycin resistance protein n=1 Tax=Pectobacterium sp. B2J-2 TaxID=3385372 RepID=UPI0038FCEDBF
MVPELTVTDFSASRHFYVRILGFTIMIHRENPDFVYLSLGEAQLMLEAFHDGGWNTGILAKPLGRGINLQIEVDDVMPLLDSLAHHHIPLYRPLKDNYYTIEASEGTTEATKACQREFLVQDPDGYLLRFSQYIEQP